MQLFTFWSLFENAILELSKKKLSRRMKYVKAQIYGLNSILQNNKVVKSSFSCFKSPKFPKSRLGALIFCSGNGIYQFISTNSKGIPN